MSEGTKGRIERCAVAEFLEKGFNGASLRQIVKDAGVTTGAFYKYYPTKEALFEGLVGPVADHIRELWDSAYEEFLQHPPSDQATAVREADEEGTRQLVDYAYEHHDAVKLLLTAAEGTAYADFGHQLATMQADSIIYFADTLREHGTPVPELDAGFVHMIESGMFSACFEVVLHDMDREQAYRRICLVGEFYLAGWERILGLRL